MALKADLNSLLRDYGPDSVFVNEYKKLSYYFNKIEKNKEWVEGSNYLLKFEAGENSRFEMGGLPNSSDINGATYLSATIANPATIVGSMKIHEKDLQKHNGDMKKSFLDFWPRNSKRFVKRFEERMSVLLMGDGSICTVTLDGTSGGVIKVDRPSLLTIGEKVEIKDNDSAAVQGYVRKIDINTKLVTIGDAPTGAIVPVNLVAFTTAAKAKVYICGTSASGEKFLSLKDFILTQANGGSDTIHGLTKADSPILQAINTPFSGTATAKELIYTLYKNFFEYDMLGRGDVVEQLVSYENFRWISLYLDKNREFAKSDVTAGVGFKSMTLTGPEGDMKITALRDMQNDWAPVVDFKGLEFAGSTLFKMKHQQSGDLFFTERVPGVGGGYQHIVDIETAGQHICKMPGNMAAVYNIPTITAVE